MRKISFSLLFGIFLLTIVTATTTQLTFNAPDDGDVSQANSRLLNVTVYNNDTSQGIDFILYGSNDSVVLNNSIIYRQANVSNGTTITFNWTSPKIRTGDDSNIVLLMYFDNQSGEFAQNLSVDNNMVLLYRFNNATSGETDTHIFDYSNGINNGSVVGEAIHNTTGRFSHAMQFNTTNYVTTSDDGDLNISNGLSIEGWFYPFSNGREVGNITQSVLQNLEINPSDGYEFDIFHISGSVYAVAYRSTGNIGNLSTFNIYENGTISNPIDILAFEGDSSRADNPKIIQVGGEIYAIVFNGAGTDGYISTVNITSTGQISNSVLHSVEYNTADGEAPSIVKVSDDIFAIAHETASNAAGLLETINISSNGTISSVISSLTFDSSGTTLNPKIIQINGSVYGIVYRGPNVDGYLSTVNILSNGTISNTVIDNFEYNGADGDSPDIIHISGNVYAIAYSADGQGSDGYIDTLQILSNGTIARSLLATYEFETDRALSPEIIHVSGDVYAITFDATSNNGDVSTVRISPDGTSIQTLDNFQFYNDGGLDNPEIISISGDTYAIAFSGNGNDGFISTSRIASDNGISKKGSYNLYTNSTTAFGSINGQTLTGSMVSGWNHLALVYNKSLGSSQQKLYINGKLVSSGTLTENINSNALNVTIGKNYNGLIDDIAIYNRTLSIEDIKEHAGIKILDQKGLNNGTGIFNNDNYNYSGKLGPALSFDGTEDVLTINDSDSLDLTNDFSISFWTYPTSLSNNMTFLAKGSGTSGTNYFIDYKTTNKVEFGFYNEGFRSISVDGSSLTTNQWNLITTTWNETSNISRVYINGVDKGNLQINYDVLSNSLDLKVGWFPGYNQNFTGLIDELVIYNKTLNSSEVTNIYQLKSQNWYWKFSGQDSGGINMSGIRSFLVGTVWGVSPTDLGEVSTSLNTNVSVGTLLINNTHATKNVTINITSDYNGTVTYNISMPFNLTGTGGNWTTIQINVTSPSTEGSTTINFNVTATDTNTGEPSVPSNIIVPVDLIATSGSPFLITRFETVPSVTSQGSDSITLKASVTNKGQGNAQNVKITYELPSGWTNSSGALTSNALLVNVNDQANYSIIVDIASNATSGNVILYANVTGQNSTGSDLSSSLKTIGSANVTVNEVSSGTGPSSTSTSSESSSGGGGGGGGGAGSGGHSESVAFSQTIETVRGEKGTMFEIEVNPQQPNTRLESLSLTLLGLPEQYATTSPSLIATVPYGSKGVFTVSLHPPTYAPYEEYAVTAIIQGFVVYPDGTKVSYVERRAIRLIVQEIALSPTLTKVDSARVAVQLMKSRNFNIDEVEALLAQAEQLLADKHNKEAYDVADTIIRIQEQALLSDNLIRRVIEANKDPRRGALLVGNAIMQFDGLDISLPLRAYVSGDTIFSSPAVQEMTLLAISAFERGDYATALERAQQAQTLLLLERKGNWGLFFYLYWPFVLGGFLFVSMAGTLGYRKYQQMRISQTIFNANKEESTILGLLATLQKQYYKGTMSISDFNRSTLQHQQRLGQLKKKRIQLRNRRIRLLSARRIEQELDAETKQLEGEVRHIQELFYNQGKLPERAYKDQFSLLQERLAEIEAERTALDLKNRTKLALGRPTPRLK